LPKSPIVHPQLNNKPPNKKEENKKVQKFQNQNKNNQKRKKTWIWEDYLIEKINKFVLKIIIF